MNRGYLALGAGLVLAAGFALYVMRSRDDEATPAPRDRQIAQAGVGKQVGDVRQRAPSATVTPDRTADSRPVTDYTVGDVRIRDHRSGEHARVDVPPAIHPPGGRKIPSQLTSGIAQKVRAVVAQCTASVPAEARGDKPRVEGEILIAIKDHQITVTRATVQLRDVDGASVDPAKRCIEERAVGATIASGDEPDVDSYAITLSFRII